MNTKVILEEMKADASRYGYVEDADNAARISYKKVIYKCGKDENEEENAVFITFWNKDEGNDITYNNLLSFYEYDDEIKTKVLQIEELCPEESIT